MASRSTIPDPLQKRNLLYSKDVKGSADLCAVGDAFLEGGRLSEAAQFYARAGDLEKIRVIKDQAIQTGDAPLLVAIAESLKNGVEKAEWAALAAAALRLEKYTGAAEAYERAGQPEEAAKAREKFTGLVRAVIPPEPAPSAETDEDAAPGQAGGQTRIGG